MKNDIRILLVDDEEFYLRLFTDILTSRQYDVLTARDGRQALELLQDEKVDILITDLLMKEMDGLELSERVREQFPWIDIIVVTQKDDVRLAVRSMRMGVFEYLVKPVDQDELLLTLDRLLERRHLLDQQTKLLDESMQYLQAQTVYRRCLEILSTLDYDNLCEVIIRHMLQAIGAQGCLMWLISPEENLDNKGTERLNLTGYRGLVSLEDFPTSFTLSQAQLAQHLGPGVPFFANPYVLLPKKKQSDSTGDALFIPLFVESTSLGLVVMLDKLHADFSERDQQIARTMAQFSAIALKNARRFQALERLGLRDQDSAAYNLTYFIDYAGKEIYKARRYGRAFSLVTIAIDRFDFLRGLFKEEICNRMTRKLPESIARAVRDSDILARVSDHEYYLLLPETDSLGARTFMRRSMSAFLSDAFIAELSQDYPVNVSVGTATFPLDGSDFDQLLMVCNEEASNGRMSLVRRLGLAEKGFWDSVQSLVGRLCDYSLPVDQSSEAFRIAEDLKGGSVHVVVEDSVVDSIEEEVCRQALDAPERRAVVYALGGEIGPEHRPIERVLGGADRVRAFLIGKRADSDFTTDLASVARVFVDDEAVEDFRLLLVMGERIAYAFLGQRQDSQLFGFHSNDVCLVEHLIATLQEHYHFQPLY